MFHAQEKTQIIVLRIKMIDLPFSMESLHCRQPFHQRITRTIVIENRTASTIPATAPTGKLSPCSDGGVKSEYGGIERVCDLSISCVKVKVKCWQCLIFAPCSSKVSEG